MDGPAKSRVEKDLENSTALYAAKQKGLSLINTSQPAATKRQYDGKKKEFEVRTVETAGGLKDLPLVRSLH